MGGWWTLPESFEGLSQRGVPLLPSRSLVRQIEKPMGVRNEVLKASHAKPFSGVDMVEPSRELVGYFKVSGRKIPNCERLSNPGMAQEENPLRLGHTRYLCLGRPRVKRVALGRVDADGAGEAIDRDEGAVGNALRAELRADNAGEPVLARFDGGM